MKTLIDLSHLVSQEMPVYPGTEAVSITNWCSIQKNGFNEKKISLFTHSGTHLDAPAHVFSNSSTLDLISLNHFHGRAILLDFSASTKSTIEFLDLKPHQQAIEKSEFVIFNTGWSKLWGKQEYFLDFPVLSSEAAIFLSNSALKGVGVDTISVDAIDSTSFPIHKILLRSNLLLIENLNNLDQIPVKSFDLYCFPLKIKDADGSPVRAVAMVNKIP